MISNTIFLLHQTIPKNQNLLLLRTIIRDPTNPSFFFSFFFSTLNPSTISSKNLMNLVPKLCSTRLVARRAISPNIQIYHWVGGCLRMGIPSGKSRRSRMKRERRPITAEGSEDDILLWVWTRCDRHEAFPIKPRAGLIAQTLSN